MTKVALAVRLHPDLRAALTELAERSRRSITGEIEHMIEERATRLGLLSKGWKRSKRDAG